MAEDHALQIRRLNALAAQLSYGPVSMLDGEFAQEAVEQSHAWEIARVVAAG